MDENIMTVGRLRQDLARFADDVELIFGDRELKFFRVKDRDSRGKHLAQIEFETLFHVDEDGVSG